MSYYVDIQDVKKLIKEDTTRIYYTTDCKRALTIDRVKVGYGDRYYFICPGCGKRRTRLYLCGNQLLCRECGDVPVYNGIQNMTKGGDEELEYRMNRFGDRHNIEVKYPFNYADFAKDERVDNENFRHNLKILQALENMRLQAIFFKTHYSSKKIKSVLTGEHPILKNKYITLQDLHDTFFMW